MEDKDGGFHTSVAPALIAPVTLDARKEVLSHVVVLSLLYPLPVKAL